MLGVKHAGGKLGGLATTVTVQDDELKPDVAVGKAKQLIERDKVDFVARWSLSGCVLVVAGDVDAEPTFSAAETWFGSAQAGADPLPSRSPVGPPSGTRVVLVDRAIPRAEIRIAWLAPARGAADEPAMLVANALYGGPPAARPGENVCGSAASCAPGISTCATPESSRSRRPPRSHRRARP